MLKSLGVTVKDLWEMKGIFVGQNISTSKHGPFFQICAHSSARLLIRQTTAMLRLSIILEELGQLATYRTTR